MPRRRRVADSVRFRMHRRIPDCIGLDHLVGEIAARLVGDLVQQGVAHQHHRHDREHHGHHEGEQHRERRGPRTQRTVHTPRPPMQMEPWKPTSGASRIRPRPAGTARPATKTSIPTGAADVRMGRHAAHPATGATNLYPMPRTVRMICGCSGFDSTLARSRWMCTVTRRVSPASSYPHTLLSRFALLMTSPRCTPARTAARTPSGSAAGPHRPSAPDARHGP